MNKPSCLTRKSVKGSVALPFFEKMSVASSRTLLALAAGRNAQILPSFHLRKHFNYLCVNNQSEIE